MASVSALRWPMRESASCGLLRRRARHRHPVLDLEVVQAAVDRVRFVRLGEPPAFTLGVVIGLAGHPDAIVPTADDVRFAIEGVAGLRGIVWQGTPRGGVESLKESRDLVACRLDEL